MPYATFVYRVDAGTASSPPTDLSVLRSPATSCSSCRRAIRASSRRTATSSYAKLVSVAPRGGTRVPSPRGDAASCGRRQSRRYADRRAGRELAVAARDEHERVGRGRAHDHVRLLAGQRLEHDAVVSPRDARAHELVARVVARAAAPRAGPAGSAARARAAPCSARSAGRDEELEADERRHRVARQPEDERRRRATPKATGLPGLTATRQNTSSTPSSAAMPRTRSCGPTETPPEVTSTSASSPRSSAARSRRRRRRPAGSTLDVGARTARAARRAGACSTRRSRPGASGSPGRAQLAAGREHGDARPARAGDRARCPTAASAPSCGGAEHASRDRDDVARARVAAARTHVRAGRDRLDRRRRRRPLGDARSGRRRRRPRARRRRSRCTIASPAPSGRRPGAPGGRLRRRRGSAPGRRPARTA